MCASPYKSRICYLKCSSSNNQEINIVTRMSPVADGYLLFTGVSTSIPVYTAADWKLEYLFIRTDCFQWKLRKCNTDKSST